ncbi:unnamed protein product [Vitrella brassicaformis CCMP3155]|uniref:MYND-type domain-containing protein n=1 Tax=Vitrella brassicaformis (strain CCMP3155) TaxID=1169540 RepID=A0A0G4ENS6_VITBC|nr:unnamed protein product [Vitrella brassicaformis CCMP3155]|mmetsp:Transcript_21662/g.53081  ORF Transcript_21662/g.53081 Transcript_21662/m.53081 type:complete len:536 (-) Transcript_21662:1554-3161(-)|eukprot:CEL99263.1 unnamed protein product [Vitrella brassicaformis CCMP3155]
MSRGIDYSKWDTLDDSDDDEAENTRPPRHEQHSSCAAAPSCNDPANTTISPCRQGCRASRPEVAQLDLHSSSRCAVCGRSPDDSRHQFPRCNKCKLLHYCTRECQVKDWKGVHKEECEMAKEKLDADRMYAPSSIQYMHGWMSSDEYFAWQRRREEALFKDIKALHASGQLDYITLNVKRMTETHVAIGMWYRTTGKYTATPPINEGTRIRKLGTADVHNMAIWRLCLFSKMPGLREVPGQVNVTPVDLIMLEGVEQLVNSAIEDIVMATDGKRAPYFIIDTDVNLEALFWRKITTKTVDVTRDRQFHWFYLPSIAETCQSAIFRAAKQLFGPAAMLQVKFASNPAALNHKFVTTAPQQLLFRKSWEKNIEFFAQTLELDKALQPFYETRAKERGVSVKDVEAELMAVALTFSDVFRMHLIDYLDGCKDKTLWRKSLAEHCQMTDQQFSRVAAELAELKPSYPNDIKNAMSMQRSQIDRDMDDVMGKKVKLKCGHSVRQLEGMLRQNGMLTDPTKAQQSMVDLLRKLISGEVKLE